MLNCTNHFNERYVERVIGIKDDREKREYIGQNRDMIYQHANTTFENATFIWKGQIGDNITRHYYIKDDTVFVTNTTNDAFITVYQVDLGLTPTLNAQVRKGLIEEIQKLQAEKDEIEFQILTEVESKKFEKESIEEQISILEQQVANLRKQKEFIGEEIKNAESKALNTGLEIKRYTLMLVNSKDYKEDMRSTK